jgi:hypothetical protein
VVRVVTAILAFLLFETGVAGIPDSIASQYEFLSKLNEESLIRLAALVLGFVFALVAIGPYRVQAWIKWASPDRSTSTAVPPADETGSTVGVYREAVGETYRSPLRVEEETDEEFLSRRCREVADKLFDFLDEQGYSKFEDLNDPKVIQRDSEALKLYNRRLRPEVAILLKELKAGGLYPPETLANHEQSSIEKALSLWAVERLANVLNEIGHG